MNYAEHLRELLLEAQAQRNDRNKIPLPAFFDEEDFGEVLENLRIKHDHSCEAAEKFKDRDGPLKRYLDSAQIYDTAIQRLQEEVANGGSREDALTSLLFDVNNHVMELDEQVFKGRDDEEFLDERISYCVVRDVLWDNLKYGHFMSSPKNGIPL